MATLPNWVAGAPPPIQGVLATVNFLPWFEVADLDAKRLSPEIQSGLQRSGTYVVAISNARPPDDPLVREVHYIGMTKGEKTSLAKRITAFATAARGGEASHSGGRTWFAEELPPTFWISAAPSFDLRSFEWSTQSWSIWPEVVEKALLMAYAHRHADFPMVNKEGWGLPLVTTQMIEGVARILNANTADIVIAARSALSPILEAWGYQSKKIYDDPGLIDPMWIGAEARLSKGYWLWIGRGPGQSCHVGIWTRAGVRWDSAEIFRRDQIEPALARVLHAWHTSAGLL
jgi:hypothetical protein